MATGKGFLCLHLFRIYESRIYALSSSIATCVHRWICIQGLRAYVVYVFVELISFRHHVDKLCQLLSLKPVSHCFAGLLTKCTPKVDSLEV